MSGVCGGYIAHPFSFTGQLLTQAFTKMEKTKEETQEGLQDFSLEVKKDILSIINDCPSLVRLGGKEYAIKDLRYYSLFRICKLATDMRLADEAMDDDNKIVTALCTDLDAMCEIMAIILCNHLFTPDGETYEEMCATRTRNEKMVEAMKMKVMNSTFEINQWAAIIIGAIKSVDLGGFFLLKKSVSTLTDSLLTRKKKSMETASQFMEALSLQMQQTS